MHKLKRLFLNSKTIIFIIGIICVTVFYWPIVSSGSNLGIQDWDQNFAWNEFTRLSITKYHQFPLWNPYRCGGSVHFANPQINVFSLQTILVLVFDTVRGIKISILVHSLIGFLGFYILARQHQISKISSILASVIFSFSSIVPSTLSTGMIPFIGIAYAPYVIYFFNKGLLNPKWIIVSSLFLALSFYFAFQTAILLAVYISIFSLFKAFFDKSIKPILYLLIFVAIFLVLSLPKLILSLQLFSIYPKYVEDYSGYRFDNILHFIFSKNQGLLAGLGTDTFYFGIDENSLYLGFLPLITFGAFFIKNKTKLKENLPLFFTIIVITILMFGSTIKFSLYEALRNIPFLTPFRIAQRFRFDFIIVFSLFAAMGMDNILRLIKTQNKRLLFTTCIILTIYFDLLVFSQKNLLSQTLIIKDNFEKTKDISFRQKISSRDEFIFDYDQGSIPKELENTVFYSPYSLEYPTIRMNTGILNCTDNIGQQTKAISHMSNEYRGEAYFQSSTRSANIKYWSPNEIDISLENMPANTTTNDLLIINQNYYPGWYVYIDGVPTPVNNHNGLIATDVSTNVNNIVFRFKPFKWFKDQFLPTYLTL